jgi:hypothetical protein
MVSTNASSVSYPSLYKRGRVGKNEISEFVATGRKLLKGPS